MRKIIHSNLPLLQEQPIMKHHLLKAWLRISNQANAGFRLPGSRRTLKCTKAQSSPCNHLKPFILKVGLKKSDNFGYLVSQSPAKELQITIDGNS